MRKILLILGILLNTVGVLALLFSALQGFGYYHLLDGDADLYTSLHFRMIISLIIGVVLVVFGVVCFIIRNKM